MRSAYLLEGAAKRGNARLPDGGGYRWLCKRSGVHPLRVVVRAGVEALPGEIGSAAKVRRRRSRACDCERLPALERVEAVDNPPAHDEIRGPAHRTSELASTAEGQVVRSGHVDEAGGIAVAQGVVAMDAEPRQPLGAVTYVVLRVLRRVLVAQALGPCVVAEQRKPKAHPVLIRYLQGVVAAGGVGGFVGAVGAEVRVGNVVLGVGAGRQDLGVAVRVPQNIQVTALG